ncbi:MAG TPA: XRE family transcriptional regulator [Candidatus Nitrosotalea sp.]|nr:XRE family transcriptional regulator [Candidatus Nitrosotalea sp.]
MAELTLAPTVLRWARETYGLELLEAADVLGVSTATLEAWEAGELTPSLPELRAMADRYKRQLATLLMARPPTVDEPRVADLRRRSDFTPPRLTPGMHMALRTARRQQLTLARLIEDAGRLQLASGMVTSNSSPEVTAAEQRSRLDVTLEDQAGWSNVSAAFRAWRSLLEEQGVLILQLTFGEEDIRGFSLPDDLVPTIAINTQDAVAGRTFSLFHEFCHLLLGEGGVCAPSVAMRYPTTSESIERFCNRFAGAFLVPLDALLGLSEARRLGEMAELPVESDFRALRDTFKVSSQVLWYRLHEAGLVDDQRYRDLWVRWAVQGPPPPRQGGTGRDRAQLSLDMNGRRFVNAVVEAEYRGHLSFADAIDSVRVRSNEWEHLAALARAE